MLGGTLTRSAASGVASFNNLTIDKAGTGYTLTASATALTPDTSAAFAVSPGTVSQIVFSVQPSSVVSGSVMSPSVEVSFRDATGNVVTSATTPVTLSITGGTGAAGAVLGGTLTRTAVGGVASFNNLTVDKAATGYTLTATPAGGSPSAVTSAAFNVTAGPAAKLGFRVQPTSANAGAIITPAIQVEVQDAAGNLVASTASVTLSIASGTGTPGAAISGTTTRAAVAGVATFNDIAISQSGTGYVIEATATSLTKASSNPFTVAAAPTGTLIYSDAFSGTLANWVEVDPGNGGTWSIVGGELIGDYDIGCGTSSCHHTQLLLANQYQPGAADWRMEVQSGLIQAYCCVNGGAMSNAAKFVLYVSDTEKEAISVGYGWQGTNAPATEDTIYSSHSAYPWADVATIHHQINWTPQQPQSVAMEKRGNTYTVYFNGQLVYTTTRTFSSPPRVGFSTYGAVRMDNFAIYSLSAPPPPVPTGLTATAVSSSRIDLAWNDVTGETGYEIERTELGVYVPLTQPGSDVTSYINNTFLSPSTQYCYRIRAVNASGASAFSAPVCATTHHQLLYADNFSGTLANWVEVDPDGLGSWTITNGELIGDYSISCGSPNCHQTQLLLSNALQPGNTNWRLEIQSGLTEAYCCVNGGVMVNAATISLYVSNSEKEAIYVGAGWSGGTAPPAEDTVNVGHSAYPWATIADIDVPFNFVPQQLQSVAVERHGNTYTVYYNGQLVYTVNRTFSSAPKIGFHTYGKTRLDNFALYALP